MIQLGKHVICCITITRSLDFIESIILHRNVICKAALYVRNNYSHLQNKVSSDYFDVFKVIRNICNN